MTYTVELSVVVVDAAGEHMVETIVEVTVEVRVIVEVRPWMVAVAAVEILVDVERTSSRTPHVTLCGKPTLARFSTRERLS